MTPSIAPGTPALKQIFERCADESISSEEMDRVLEPVLALIRAGVYDRPRRKHRLGRLIKLLAQGQQLSF